MTLYEVLLQIRAGVFQPYFDFDGTLAPFTAIPSQARPYGELTSYLYLLDTELVSKGLPGILFVTGREYHEMPALLNHKLVPRGGFEHGAKLRFSEYETACVLSEEQLKHLSVIENQAQAYCHQLQQNFPAFNFNQLIERKHFSLALHWRLLEQAKLPGLDIKVIIQAFAKILNQNLGEAFSVLSGDMNLELQLKTVSKGQVIKKLQSLIGQPALKPVFFGDDFLGTDGSAAKAVWELGGFVVMMDNGKDRVEGFLKHQSEVKEGEDYLIIRTAEPQQLLEQALKVVMTAGVSRPMTPLKDLINSPEHKPSIQNTGAGDTLTLSAI